MAWQQEEYPDYKKTEPRALTIADFPERALSYPRSARYYLSAHHVFVSALPKTVYPTERGICFVMSGPALCFQERITVKSSPLRFWSPAGAPLGKVLYVPAPLSAEPRPVYVVEGLTDAVAVFQSGFDTVSLIGAKVSDEQLQLLYGLGRKLILIPDNDEAGEQCCKTLQRELSIQSRHLPSQYKDICDLPVDYRQSFLAI